MITVHGHTRVALVAALALVLLTPGALLAQAPDKNATTVRITSPLGRTGFAGTIRIVAQVVTPAPDGIVPVRFFVDGHMIYEDGDGPPYVAEWVDQNPYEAREIRVDVYDLVGGFVSDTVSLSPMDVSEESRVASVLVEASVLDEQGKAISSFPGSAFSVFEDDIQQAIDLVQLQRIPTTFTLLVDASQSMSRRIDLVRLTAKRLTSRLRDNDMVVVAPFRRSIEPHTGPTNDAATITDAIMEVRAGGGTAIADSLAALPALFAKAEGRHIVILVTDGYDEHSQVALDDALGTLRELNATVYVVGIGGVAGISLKGELLLRRIAVQTGGRAFFPAREEQLPDVHDTIASDVYSRYLLTYTPTNQEPDGTYRRIRVTIPDPAFKVVARAGYFAPKPPPIRPTLEFSATTATVEGDIALAADDFTVLEDGVAQQIESFQEANTPISLVLALDGSGSIKAALEGVKSAALTFIESLRPSDPLALVQFADDVLFAHDFSTQRSLSEDAIRGHRATTGTALWDALHSSMALLQRRPGRRAVVVVTDGRDENNPGTAPGSVHTLAQVLEKIRETETTVYAIGLGPRVDQEGLQAVAEASGGAAFFPQDVATMAEPYRRVVDDLRRRYLLTYTSTNSRRDGAWREVRITTSKPGVTIRSRGGYAAPARAVAATAGAQDDSRK